MYPIIHIGKYVSIPMYSTVFIIGFFFAILIGRRICHKFGIQKDDFLYSSIYAAIGLVVGSKAFYFFSKLPVIIPNFSDYIDSFKKDPTYMLSYSFGGLVFYGGLIGGALGAIIYCKQFKLEITPYLGIYAPLIPFMHGFGRISCFLGGCCYGIEYHGFGSIQFPYNSMIPELSAVPRVPVQLIEASLNFIVFGILLFIANKYYKSNNKEIVLGKHCSKLLGFYLLYYTIARFFLEMLRGDSIRGSFGILSTSQLISVLLIPVTILLLRAKPLKKKEKI